MMCGMRKLRENLPNCSKRVRDKRYEDFDTDEKAEDKYRYLRASILPE